MILDDEASIRSLMHRVLQSMGHETIEAEDGEAALKQCEKRDIDLYFVDIHLPNISGLQFLEKIKEKDPNAIVIMMTGYPSAETIMETIEDDGYTYITKPLDLDHIRDLVQRGLAAREARLNNQWE